MGQLLEMPTLTVDEVETDEILVPVGTGSVPHAIAAPPAIGIIGPGLVGSKLIKYFEDSEIAEITRVFASYRSAGDIIEVGGHPVQIELASEADYGGLFAVCNTAPAGFAKDHAERIADEAGYFVDASSDLRKDPSVPLIIPEINPDAIHHAENGILAKSNCTTTIGSLAIYGLHEVASLRSLSVSTYQSISGQGWPGINEFRQHVEAMLTRQKEMLDGRTYPSYPQSEVFPELTAFNVAPKAGTFEGYDTSEELKYKNETRKIFGLDEDVTIDVTCARVPVFNGHSVDIHAQFDRPISAGDAKDILAETPGVELHTGEDVPQPVNAVGTTDVHVGRVRQSELFGQYGLRLWATGDNLTVGAAHNIFKTVRLLISQV